MSLIDSEKKKLLDHARSYQSNTALDLRFISDGDSYYLVKNCEKVIKDFYFETPVDLIRGLECLWDIKKEPHYQDVAQIITVAVFKNKNITHDNYKKYDTEISQDNDVEIPMFIYNF